MLPLRCFTKILKNFTFQVNNLNKNYLLQRCNYCKTIIKEEETVDKQKTLGEIGAKYQVFQDKDADIILDVYEEKLKYQHLLEEKAEEVDDPFNGINLERGVSGVFDIEDLVEVLKRENAVNIFVTEVPPEIKYVDYLCIASGKSQKHMQAIIQFVRRVYKQKKQDGDIVPRVEGEKSKDWIALDLGNIALHVFSKEARTIYDLDTLWAVGPKYDDEFNKPEPISDMLEKHSMYLQGLEPAS